MRSICIQNAQSHYLTLSQTIQYLLGSTFSSANVKISFPCEETKYILEQLKNTRNKHNVAIHLRVSITPASSEQPKLFIWY